MSIGILYESKEWSSYALEQYINEMGVPARLIDMQEEPKDLLSYDLIVNRVFASSIFRGHEKALQRMPGVIALLKANGIPMVNPYDAHFYEISKAHSTRTLEAHGITVPKVFDVFMPRESGEQVIRPTGKLDDLSPYLVYPCIVKPDCGGRTNYTYIVNDFQELRQCMKEAPDIPFIAEEYIYPEYGYTTRIEVIGRSCRLIKKRSVAENGLSAYHLGSTYAAYDDCSADIKIAAVRAMDTLQIGAGSLDIIENRNGFYIIDVNSVSNASEDNTEMFSFDLMKETAAYIVSVFAGLV